MISFVISIVCLVLGYFIYGAVVDKIFGPDNRKTPAIGHPDGVDYVALPTWKVFMIQFLNIAGTGPIFGAIMGMLYGPAAYLWIVLGCIFGGAVHDYLTGMLSLRHDGAGYPELVGKYLGKPARGVMVFFTIYLMIMVGAVFVASPALILSKIWGGKTMWIIIIFVYYLVATLLPIDKVIGRVYPLFALSLLFMAAALMVVLFVKHPVLPELWHMGDMSSWDTGGKAVGAKMFGVESMLNTRPLFPCLFITVACGAISGFHATQSPLMARCMKSERLGRPIFYGAMITEGFVALIWATISSYFFYYGGWREIVPAEMIADFNNAYATKGQTVIQYFDAPKVVKLVCDNWLGVVGSILALLGVVAAPVSSGDTALRSARLIIAETFHVDQKSILSRLTIAVPLFAATTALLLWQLADNDGFNIIWNYFGWSNQTLAVFGLWTVTVYLAQKRKPYIITLLPAVFMTVVCTTFFLVSPSSMALPISLTPWISAAVTIIAFAWFFTWKTRYDRKHPSLSPE